jgi:hypothetical protein
LAFLLTDPAYSNGYAGFNLQDGKLNKNTIESQTQPIKLDTAPKAIHAIDHSRGQNIENGREKDGAPMPR